jgi:hypothetical protein
VGPHATEARKRDILLFQRIKGDKREGIKGIFYFLTKDKGIKG